MEIKMKSTKWMLTGVVCGMVLLAGCARQNSARISSTVEEIQTIEMMPSDAAGEEAVLVEKEKTEEGTFSEEELVLIETEEILSIENLSEAVDDQGNPIPQYEGYELVWHDEFSEPELDKSIWSMVFALRGANNHELQSYELSEENVYIEDGKLMLRAIENISETGGKSYTSGKVTTQDKMDMMYGKIVVCGKVPAGKGLWPAIWMLPTDEALYGHWPTCGEIDIMEILGDDVTTTYSTIHYGAPHLQQQGAYKLENGSFADEFHEFSVEWEPDEMRFYVDDELNYTAHDWFCSFNGIDKLDFPAPFDQTFYLQLNLAVGGDWPGHPDETTDFTNAVFEVDYVRVYQKTE